MQIEDAESKYRNNNVRKSVELDYTDGNYTVYRVSLLS